MEKLTMPVTFRFVRSVFVAIPLLLTFTSSYADIPGLEVNGNTIS